MLERLSVYIKTVLGAALMGFVLEVFFVPMRITVGGVGGIATVIHYFCGLPVGLLIVLLNIPIFALGFFGFGRRFTALSLLGTGVMSLSADLCASLPIALGDAVPAVVLGGGLYGLGMGVVLEAGASTGGTDIAAKYLARRLGTHSLGTLVLFIDAGIIALCGFVFKSFDTVLYSAAALYIGTYVLDVIVGGFNLSRAALIISERSDEIISEIYSVLDCGVTRLVAVSAYTGREQSVLLCVIGRQRVNKLKFLIKSADPNAFVVLMSAREVLGNGFKKLTEGEEL